MEAKSRLNAGARFRPSFSFHPELRFIGVECVKLTSQR
jgi:hypothetical protein